MKIWKTVIGGSVVGGFIAFIIFACYQMYKNSLKADECQAKCYPYDTAAWVWEDAKGNCICDTTKLIIK
jgi:hypothetical protein